MHWAPFYLVLAFAATVLSGSAYPLLAAATVTPIIYAAQLLAAHYPERETR